MLKDEGIDHLYMHDNYPESLVMKMLPYKLPCVCVCVCVCRTDTKREVGVRMATRSITVVVIACK